MVGGAISYAPLGGFAIGARVSLLWQHSTEREMSVSACTCSMLGYYYCHETHTHSKGCARAHPHSVCSSCIVLKWHRRSSGNRNWIAIEELYNFLTSKEQQEISFGDAPHPHSWEALNGTGYQKVLKTVTLHKPYQTATKLAQNNNRNLHPLHSMISFPMTVSVITNMLMPMPTPTLTTPTCYCYCYYY